MDYSSCRSARTPGEWDQCQVLHLEGQARKNLVEVSGGSSIQSWKYRPAQIGALGIGQFFISQPGPLSQNVIRCSHQDRWTEDVMQKGQGGDEVEVMGPRSVVRREEGAHATFRPEHSMTLLQDSRQIL